MDTEKLIGSGFLADLVELAEEIDLDAKQTLAIAAYLRRHEAEVVEIAAELVAEDLAE